MTIPYLRTSIGRSPCRRAWLLIPLALAWLALSPAPNVFGVIPAPDGGYPGGNTAEGQAALLSLTTGGFNTGVGFLSLRSDDTGGFNTAIGAGALLANTGNENTGTGAGALLSNTTGRSNTANAAFALFSNTTGGSNTANGEYALYYNTTGFGNTAIGFGARYVGTTGSQNIALGSEAGGNLATGNYNIDIGNFGGFTDESGVIRIGTAGNQSSTFIAGIYGVTTGHAAIPAVIDSTGQLGTVSSSKRFKKEIRPMDRTSEAILSLKPVTFHYKSDHTGTPQFGLIAEEVAQVNPDLVVRDDKGEIYTVRYDAVNAMLLNEFLKAHSKMEQQEATVARQGQDFQGTIAELKKEIASLTTTVKEQASEIQKVSAQFAAAISSQGGVEVDKPAPQIVRSNQ